MSSVRPLPPSSPHRNLDEFLDEAFLPPITASLDSREPVLEFLRECSRAAPLLLPLACCNAADAIEILSLGYCLSDPVFLAALGSSSAGGGDLGPLAAAVFCGMLVGGLCGPIGDSYGRKPVLLGGLGASFVSGLAGSMVGGRSLLAASRFVCGIGVGVMVPALFSLAGEWSPARRRGAYLTAVASGWMVGGLYAAAVAKLVLGTDRGAVAPWRIYLALCALPSGACAAWTAAAVPESPRWILARGDAEEDRNSPPPGGEEGDVRPHHVAAARHASLLAARCGRGPASGVAPLLPMELAAHRTRRRTVRRSANPFYGLYLPFVRRTTLLLQLTWACLSFSTYGISTWISSIFASAGIADFYSVSILFAASQFPGNFVSLLSLDFVGRTTFAMMAMGTSAACLGAAAWSSHVSSVAGLVASSCAFQAANVGAWNAVAVATPEMFSTDVRVGGGGACSAAGRAGAAAAMVFNGRIMTGKSGGDSTTVLLVAMMSLLCGATAVGMLGGNEMTGKTLVDRVRERLEGGGERDDEVFDFEQLTQTEIHSREPPEGNDNTCQGHIPQLV